MTTTAHGSIRPAGAPMVAMSRPGAADAGTGASATLADDAREAADRAREQARDIATERIGDISSELGRRAATLADDLRAVAHELDQRGRGAGARVAVQAGDQADRAGRYLADADLEHLIADARRVLRARPLLAAAGVVATGAVLGRAIRAAAEAPVKGGVR